MSKKRNMCCQNGQPDGPTNYPFRIDAGATFTATIFWQLQDTPDVAPVSVDLTGYTARLVAGIGGCSNTLILDLTTENGGITLGGTDGRIDLLALASATADLRAGQYIYHLDLTASDEITVTRLLTGFIFVSAATPPNPSA